MGIVQRFTAQNSANQHLLLKALRATIVVRAALWLMPFAVLQRLILNARAESSLHLSAEPEVERIAWAVSAVSRYVPRASCLTQALTTQFLLGRRGYASQIQFGVRKDRQTGFEAHAWLLFENKVVIGGQGLDRFANLPTWEARL